MLQLRYFASLREELGLADERIELPAGVATIAQLTEWLRARGPRWSDALAVPKLLTARNHALVARDTIVQDGDEIAWFPPVTGG